MTGIRTIGLIIFITLTQVTYGQTKFDYARDFKTILAKTKDSNDSLYYDRLLTLFKENSPSLTDFHVLSLMIGFTDKPDYKPYDDLSTERELYKLNGEDEYQKALELGRKFLDTHPLSEKALFEVSYSFHKQNQEDSAQCYLVKGRRILKAMYFSGNGRTKETPTFALGPADGQDYIGKVVGASIGTMGSGFDNNGNFLDILEAKFESGETLTLYFIIQHASNKMFGGSSPEEPGKQKGRKKGKE